MSLKEMVVKHKENVYKLPKHGSMKTEVTAFLSEALFQSSDAQLWDQAAAGASYEGVVGAYLMPDCHLGFGVPIGSVIVTEGTLIQAGSGYDISCGICYLKVPELSASDLVPMEKRRQWINAVELRMATGVGSGRPKLMASYSEAEINNLLRFGAKALDVSADYCERQYIPIDESLDLNKIEKAYTKAQPQLGSLGGGNHYCEMQVDQKTGEVFIMIHCGSRGYGWQTANHFFYAGAELRNLPSNRREDSWLYADEALGKEYWAHHNSAANYAIANRHVIIKGVQDALQEVFGVQGEIYYEISHNLIQEETLVLPDGSIKTGLVHRKGATRAFPGGHPSLRGSKWEETGHPILIPGSMFDGAAILFAQANAIESGYSINHGSGRILARGAAKRQLADQQSKINEEMHAVKRTLGGVEIQGILSNQRNIPLDECAHVYKNLDEVLGVLENNNIAKVSNRLYPVANIKGLD